MEYDYQYSYYYDGVAKLNIIADYDDCADAPKIGSVRLTFDNPASSRCERNAPYAAFGNAADASTYVGVTIPLGYHTITATPYTGPICNGVVAGTPLTRTFYVYGCSVYYNVYNAKTNSFFAKIPYDGGGTVASPPCEINIEAEVYCGSLAFTTVKLELSGTKSASRVETAAPYFLFGDTVSPRDVLKGTLAAGPYSIRVTIADIVHDAVPFTLGKCV